MSKAYYNDINPDACAVLRARIADGTLPPGDVDHRDIREVSADELRNYNALHLFAGVGGIPYGLRLAGVPDDLAILTGGFPCQDISHTGKQAGIDGPRSGLWAAQYRLICALRPRYVLVENVAALLSRGMGRVLGDLAAGGYDAEWDCLPAAAFGAPHERDRLYLVAYPYQEHGRAGLGDQPNGPPPIFGVRPIQRAGLWLSAPGCPAGMDDGVSPQLYARRVEMLGNAVVPQAVAYVGRGILAHAHQEAPHAA